MPEQMCERFWTLPLQTGFSPWGKVTAAVIFPSPRGSGCGSGTPKLQVIRGHIP
jgi:hypothetical protein